MCACVALAATVAEARTSTAPLDPDRVNAAVDNPLLRVGNRGAAVTRAQILLDRAWFSCGEIDGRFAANMQRMVKAYQLARGLNATGTVTPQTWQSLREDTAPLLVRYTITAQDAVGPFERTPPAMAERALLKALNYQSLEEALGEKFHSSASYLKQLNPGAKFQEGQEIVVPNAVTGKPPSQGTSVEIDKAARVLYVLDNVRRPVAGFPISIGNERNDPLPIGRMTIRNEVKNPTFTYDPALLKNAPKDAQKVEVAAGPNNPVGNLWLGLSKPHWGIHGTPDPSNVGHTETNGCIHLTNWDAQRLASLVKPGFRVNVRP